MRITNRALLSVLLLVGGPCVAAMASDGLQMSETHAFFNYGQAAELNDVDNDVDEVAFLSDCCDEPSCGCEEPSCGCDDPCCGDDCGDGCGDACGCAGGKKAAAKGDPCAKSHKGVYYANDFSYLKDPCYKGCCLGDELKLMPVGNCGTLDIGGQFRLRYHSEESMGGGSPAFDGSDNDFLLSRLRLYGNYKANDWARLYVEGIFADVSGAPDGYVPRAIDRNYGDLLNAFVDIKLTDTTTFRIGRQELVYGAQRHISPLDWANTRRTFEGAKVMYKHDDWSIDGFYTNFVPVDADDFDEADYDRSFYGVYATNTASKSASFDLFYIGFDDERSNGTISQDFSLHTIGSRLFGGSGPWLYEMEAAYQFGRQSGLNQDHRAGMCTVGMGRKLDMKWTPTVWFYYDYASGNDQDGSTFNRYNQLFPLAHKYLGFADFAARSNISSPNVLITAKPSKKLSLLAWYYLINSDQEADIVPGVASGVPAANQSTTENEYLHELDLIAKYQICNRSNILFGYSKVWAGDKIINTAEDNADFFYTQWELNF